MASTVGWSVDKHRIEVRVESFAVRVAIDEVDQPLMLDTRVLGEWPLTVGKRDVRLVRVRNLDVARNELWVNGTRVPPSEFRIPRRKAAEDAMCERHPNAGGEAYRAAAVVKAKIACGVCGVNVCRDCRAVDGVRCGACFEDAERAMEKKLRQMRVMGPIAGAGLGALMVVIGAAAGVPKIAGIGVSAIALMVYLVVYGLWRERVEAREREARGIAARSVVIDDVDVSARE